MSRFEDVKDRPVGSGYLAMIDYSGTIGGAPIAKLSGDAAGIGEGKDFWMFIGEPEFLPGFSAALTGMAINETKAVKTSFPADFKVKAVAGKEAEYSVHVKAVRTHIIKEIDADFLKQMEVDSAEALRAKIRNELLESGRKREDYRLKEEIAKALLEKADFDLPKSVVDHETAVTARNIVERIAMQGGTREQIEQRRNDILSEATQTSTDRVKLSYILSRIADEEKIEVQDAEIDGRIEAMAVRYNMSAGRFRAEIEKRDGMDKLRSDIRAEKTLDVLLQGARAK
jgi:trigger factor